MTREADVIAWLAELAVRISPTMSQEQVEVLARDFGKGFVDLPSEAFCSASRHAASLRFERFPPFKALRKFLEEWHAKNCTATAKLLPPVEDPALSDEDRAHVRAWINNRADGGNLAVRLDLYRQRWPAAYRYILRTDAEAERIARQRGWMFQNEETPEARAESWKNITEHQLTAKLIELERLSKSGERGAGLAAGLLALMRKAIETHAPQMAHLLPDRFEGERAPRRSVAEQVAALGAGNEAVKDAATGPWENRRSRADDLAELLALRANPNLPNRDRRIAALEARLGPAPQTTPAPPAPEAPAAPADWRDQNPLVARARALRAAERRLDAEAEQEARLRDPDERVRWEPMVAANDGPDPPLWTAPWLVSPEGA